jgi:hypothetical protein
VLGSKPRKFTKSRSHGKQAEFHQDCAANKQNGIQGMRHKMMFLIMRRNGSYIIIYNNIYYINVY